MICADLHCHTQYSHDCFTPIAKLAEMAKRRGLTHLAITDHDEIEGALRMREEARGLEIIVGCEISLEGGAHLIGLFLERKVTARTALEAAAEIHAQGGLVVVPHPFQPVSGLLAGGEDERLLAAVDAVEVCNGHEPRDRNERALEMGRRWGKPMLVGGDSHYLYDVGRACVVFPGVEGKLTREILLTAPRQLFGPTQDLSALHMADAQFRANTAPGLRQRIPKPLRKLAKRVNWLRFQRRVETLCREPVRQEFGS